MTICVLTSDNVYITIINVRTRYSDDIMRRRPKYAEEKTMEIKNRRMTDEERYQMLYDTIVQKRDAVYGNYKFARKNGKKERADRYFTEFLALDTVTLIMADDNELLQFAHIWEVIDELPDDLKDA